MVEMETAAKEEEERAEKKKEEIRRWSGVRESQTGAET